MIVLDTNVVSELMKANPNVGVATWALAAEQQFYVTSITVGEVFSGIERLPASRRRSTLTNAAEGLFTDFIDFMLDFDALAARRYGALVARRILRGHPISTEDGQIAAICSVHNMACATRNVSDFDDLGLSVVNPWRPGADS